MTCGVGVVGSLRPTHDDETVMDGAPVSGGEWRENGEQQRGNAAGLALGVVGGGEGAEAGGGGLGGEVALGHA